MTALAARQVLRVGPVSLVVRLRGGLAAAAVLLLAVVAGCAAVAVGDYTVALPDVLRALAGDGDRGALLVVREFRLPRVLTGLLVGAALGLAGAVTSAVARNPLATPDVLGVTAGASAAAVAVLLLGWRVPLSLAALLGGLLTATLVAVLSWRGGLSGPRMVLVGIACTALGSALTSFLLVRAELADAQRAVVWLTGSLSGRGWEHVQPVGLALLLLVPLTLLLGRQLALLQLGDDLARVLGTRVTLARTALLAAAVALASVATASAGPVSFVALLAPQVALRLARSAGPPLVGSAATGALLVVAADLVGRTLPLDTDLPVGAVTALLGAPLLLVMLRRSLTGRTS